MNSFENQKDELLFYKKKRTRKGGAAIERARDTDRSSRPEIQKKKTWDNVSVDCIIYLFKEQAAMRYNGQVGNTHTEGRGNNNDRAN